MEGDDMKKHNYFLVVFALVFLVDILFCQEYPKVQLPTTQIREIESEFVENMVYDLFIDLPPGYVTSDKKYPVVYLLDAYETYGLMLQTYQQLIFMHEIPEMIIVGISYQIEGDFYTEGLREYLDIRARDYLPTYLPRKKTAKYIRYSGGGKEFLSFIEKELIPFINLEFRTDPDQSGLFGYSLGGTFTTFCLLSKPELFKKYFIGSPMLSWDNWAVYKFDNTDKLYGSSDTLNVYISWGELESKSGKHHPLKDYLLEKNNPYIIFHSEVLEGETHLSGIGLAYSRAFRRLYGTK